MQSSIKNQTGEHTVLGNAEALKSGALKATDLPEIRIWQDADGKLWTLDHRLHLEWLSWIVCHLGGQRMRK